MDSLMREKLLEVVEESQRLAKAMSTQEIAADPEAYRKHAQAHAELANLVASFERFQLHEQSLAEAEHVIAEESDAEILELAEEERASLRQAPQYFRTGSQNSDAPQRSQR